MEINKVFVYGTLLSGLRNHGVIKPYIKSTEKGKTKGILYDLVYGYPALIFGEGEVTGELIEVTDIKEALLALDCLEGYIGPNHPKNLYERITQEITTEKGTKHLAYLYLWVNQQALKGIGTLVPSGDWKKAKRDKEEN